MLVDDAQLNGNELCDQVVVVTGAGQGIGKAAALILARLGACVVIALISGFRPPDRADLLCGLRQPHLLDVFTERKIMVFAPLPLKVGFGLSGWEGRLDNALRLLLNALFVVGLISYAARLIMERI